MKKIIVTLLATTSLLMSSEAILGEFSTPKNNTPSMFNIKAGLWHINWDQTSTASGALQDPSDAFNTSYKIGSAPAAMIDINLNYGSVTANTEYYNSGNIDGFNFDISLLKYIPFLNLEFRYVKADFKGAFTSTGYVNHADAELEFKSPLQIMDVIAYPFNEYIGVGYRTYNYELPQDYYLLNNTSGALVPIPGSGGNENGGWTDVKYDGQFYTLVLDNKKQVSSHSNYNGLLYSAVMGIGKLTPTDLQSAGNNQYMADSDATLYDFELGYSYKSKSDSGFGYGIGAGYRYNKIETKSNNSSTTHTLVTEFNTEFHGPFIDVSVNF